MLRKGDICIYLPSGREVRIASDQNSGTVVAVKDLSKKPTSILRVPPADVRRIEKIEGVTVESEQPEPIRAAGAWAKPEPEPWDGAGRRCTDPACPVPHPHVFHGGRIS